MFQSYVGDVPYARTVRKNPRGPAMRNRYVGVPPPQVAFAVHLTAVPAGAAPSASLDTRLAPLQAHDVPEQVRTVRLPCEHGEP